LNRVQTTEQYTIEQFWTQSETDRKYRCRFFPYSIDNLLKKPVDRVRTMPLGIAYPKHEILSTEVLLPESWPAYHKAKIVSDPAFSFRMKVTTRGRRLTMAYEYVSLTNTVPPARVADYLQKVDSADKTLGYSLTW
ncbi:MAG TPA: hypothetical protein VKA67_08700, partial [Verrucomicrobiae bacterium]|nr:hypothetical protein [Verrucomicrobiae bacterium]